MEDVNVVIVCGRVKGPAVPIGPGLFRVAVEAEGSHHLVTVEVDGRTRRNVEVALPDGAEVLVVGQLVTRRVEVSSGRSQAVTRILATYVGAGLVDTLAEVVRSGHGRQ